MQASLNAVDISNTWCNIVYFSDFSLISFLSDIACVWSALRDFSINLYLCNPASLAFDTKPEKMGDKRKKNVERKIIVSKITNFCNEEKILEDCSS
jgi:hypothetical protein